MLSKLPVEVPAAVVIKVTAAAATAPAGQHRYSNVSMCSLDWTFVMIALPVVLLLHVSLYPTSAAASVCSSPSNISSAVTTSTSVTQEPLKCVSWGNLVKTATATAKQFQPNSCCKGPGGQPTHLADTGKRRRLRLIVANQDRLGGSHGGHDQVRFMQPFRAAAVVLATHLNTT